MVMSGKKCPKCGAELVQGASYCQRCGTRIFENDFGNVTDDPYIGTIIDDTFEIQSVLGTGSMGIVYKAHHRALNCEVAIKILRHDFLNDRVVQTRFQREAQAASSLSHPNIIRIYHYGRTSLNAPYIAMECVDGKELSSLIPDQFPLTPKRICHIASQTAHALSAAHHANIIHRDLKPANIIVMNRNNDDFVKVLDFGIAKIADVEGEGLTREGAICGTPAFMSPEQVIGRNITPQSDIFSLGSTLYYMLTCRLPFHGESLVDMSRSVMALAPIPPSQVRLDCYVVPELESICLKALEKDPANRFASADEMAFALDSLYPNLPDDTSNIKPKIVFQSTDVAALDDLSGATACIPAYNDGEEDIDSEIEEAGTVVEMPAYADDGGNPEPSVYTTHTNTDMSSSKNPIVYAVSQVLEVINPSDSDPGAASFGVSHHEETIRKRKRLLLGLFCILVGLCLLIFLVTWLAMSILGPSKSGEKTQESASAAAAAQESIPPEKGSDAQDSDAQDGAGDNQAREAKRPSMEVLIKTDAAAESGKSSLTLAAAYGALDLPEEDSKALNAARSGADDADGDPSAEPEKAGDSKPKAQKKTRSGSGKSAQTKTSPNKSKTAGKTKGTKKVSYAVQFAQAEKLEKSGDKVKACQLYRQILRGEGISQGEKLKVQAKIRNCGRIKI